jgi:recombination protein RecT
MTNIQRYEDNAIAPATGPNGMPVTWGQIANDLAAFIPEMMPKAKLLEQAFFLMRANPTLITCQFESMVAALLKAHSLGLDPCLPNEFWLIPRKIQGTLTVTTQVGYNGLRRQAMRSGSYKDVKAHVVFEGDDFDVELVTGAMHHRPLFNGKRGDAVCAYAVAILQDGTLDPEVMSEDQINAIRNRSDAWKSGRSNPWQTDWSEMARKTVLKRLCKRLDLGADAARALRDEDAIGATTTPIQPAAQVLPSLPAIKATPAAIAEELIETSEPLSVIPSFGEASQQKARDLGCNTPEDVHGLLCRGIPIPKMRKEAIDYLANRYGSIVMAQAEARKATSTPDKYETALRDLGEHDVPAWTDCIVADLLERRYAVDEEDGHAMFLDGLKQANLQATQCTLEQVAGVWRSLVEG